MPSIAAQQSVSKLYQLNATLVVPPNRDLVDCFASETLKNYLGDGDGPQTREPLNNDDVNNWVINLCFGHQSNG